MRYLEIIEAIEAGTLREATERTSRGVVHIDPSFSQLSQLVPKTRYKEMRGIVDRQHFYVWDARNATHEQMGKEIGLDWSRSYFDFVLFFIGTQGEEVHSDANVNVAAVNNGIELRMSPGLVERFAYDNPTWDKLLEDWGYYDTPSEEDQ